MPTQALAETSTPPRVGPGFVALLTLAYVGAFSAFVPLLSIIVPLQAQQLSVVDKIGLLGVATAWGAGVATVANLAAGWGSDRTRFAWGRRRPWILLGLIGVLAAYGLIGAARTPTGLIVGVIAFQLGFNLMFAPLTAILADRVPDAQKGRVAAFLGLGAPMGAATGVLIAAPLLPDAGARLALLGAIVVACVLPLVLAWKEPAGQGSERTRPSRLHFTADFGFAWMSRFCFQIAASVINAFMLFYLADHARYAEQFPGQTAESGLARLIALSTVLIVASGFVGGLLSDQLGSRRRFILAASLILAGGLMIFALWPQWPGPLIGYALYGVGFGLYTTVDAALVAQVLPSRRDAARDLGVMNLTNTLPAVVAPMLALLALGPERSDWPSLMLVSAGAALVGGLLVMAVRHVR